MTSRVARWKTRGAAAASAAACVAALGTLAELAVLSACQDPVLDLGGATPAAYNQGDAEAPRVGVAVLTASLLPASPFYPTSSGFTGGWFEFDPKDVRISAGIAPGIVSFNGDDACSGQHDAARAGPSRSACDLCQSKSGYNPPLLKPILQVPWLATLSADGVIQSSIATQQMATYSELAVFSQSAGSSSVWADGALLQFSLGQLSGDAVAEKPALSVAMRSPYLVTVLDSKPSDIRIRRDRDWHFQWDVDDRAGDADTLNAILSFQWNTDAGMPPPGSVHGSARCTFPVRRREGAVPADILRAIEAPRLSISFTTNREGHRTVDAPAPGFVRWEAYDSVTVAARGVFSVTLEPPEPPSGGEAGTP